MFTPDPMSDTGVAHSPNLLPGGGAMGGMQQQGPPPLVPGGTPPTPATAEGVAQVGGPQPAPQQAAPAPAEQPQVPQKQFQPGAPGIGATGGIYAQGQGPVTSQVPERSPIMPSAVTPQPGQAEQRGMYPPMPGTMEVMGSAEMLVRADSVCSALLADSNAPGTEKGSEQGYHGMPVQPQKLSHSSINTPSQSKEASVVGGGVTPSGGGDLPIQGGGVEDYIMGATHHTAQSSRGATQSGFGLKRGSTVDGTVSQKPVIDPPQSLQKLSHSSISILAKQSGCSTIGKKRKYKMAPDTKGDEVSLEDVSRTKGVDSEVPPGGDSSSFFGKKSSDSDVVTDAEYERGPLSVMTATEAKRRSLGEKTKASPEVASEFWKQTAKYLGKTSTDLGEKEAIVGALARGALKVAPKLFRGASRSGAWNKAMGKGLKATTAPGLLNQGARAIGRGAQRGAKSVGGDAATYGKGMLSHVRSPGAAARGAGTGAMTAIKNMQAPFMNADAAIGKVLRVPQLQKGLGEQGFHALDRTLGHALTLPTHAAGSLARAGLFGGGAAALGHQAHHWWPSATTQAGNWLPHGNGHGKPTQGHTPAHQPATPLAPRDHPIAAHQPATPLAPMDHHTSRTMPSRSLWGLGGFQKGSAVLNKQSTDWSARLAKLKQRRDHAGISNEPIDNLMRSLGKEAARI